MDVERWWQPFVEVVALAWVVLFAADVAIGVDALTVSDSLAETIRSVLQWLLVVFLLDLALLYRWSDQRPRAFLRSHWFLVLTVVPWFRPLRLLRLGRSVRAFRALSGSRRAGSLVAKLRRKGHRLWRRLRD